jgi:hypothetical protein
MMCTVYVPEKKMRGRIMSLKSPRFGRPNKQWATRWDRNMFYAYRWDKLHFFDSS